LAGKEDDAGTFMILQKEESVITLRAAAGRAAGSGREMKMGVRGGS
jgi:hypothetical protein